MAEYTSFDSFLLFGDSITQFAFDVDNRGWGAQLANVFQRRLDIVNRGFSGYTTEQAIHLLPQIIPTTTTTTSTTTTSTTTDTINTTSSTAISPTATPKVQFLTLFLGANDAALPPSAQHTPLLRYAQNLRTLLDMIHDPSSRTYSPWTRIIVICPPPVEEALWAVECKKRGMDMNRDWRVTKQYAEMCRQVANEYSAKARGGNGGSEEKDEGQLMQQLHQVDVIDTWEIMTRQVESGQRKLSDFLRDGVHLAAEGNNIVFEEIMEIIRRKYPEWDPTKMQMHGPLWRELDLDHPKIDLMICTNKNVIIPRFVALSRRCRTSYLKYITEDERKLVSEIVDKYPTTISFNDYAIAQCGVDDSMDMARLHCWIIKSKPPTCPQPYWMACINGLILSLFNRDNEHKAAIVEYLEKQGLDVNFTKDLDQTRPNLRGMDDPTF
ncbi:MAG: SGNH hydrolase-type esterase domain-containing protein [Linnemannia gamsii]|nr:MAG: SGNH hydrolase-type esterase domain-containing protein [Linnemannia gamsii]